MDPLHLGLVVEATWRSEKTVKPAQGSRQVARQDVAAESFRELLGVKIYQHTSVEQ
jgi:hypothetical protein